MSKRLSKKQVEKISIVLEKALDRSSIITKVDGDLVSIYFPENTKIKPIITQLREDLDDQGFYLFHSTILYKETPVLSFNISKH